MTNPETTKCDSLSDLLGVYALDALEPDEAARVRHHLQTCPRCAAEVDEHREAIALLAAGGGTAPKGVWERIATSISAEGGPPHDRQAPRFTPSPHRRVRRRANPGWVAGLAAAAVVAAVIGLQTARVDRLNHRVDQLSSAAGQAGGFQGLAAALVDPSASHYTLDATTGARPPVGQLIVLPSGASYLVGSRLPQLATDRTYQLWSMINGRAVAVGLLGAHPDSVAFSVDPSVRSAAYLITVEPAGGVVAPTSAPVADATT